MLAFCALLEMRQVINKPRYLNFWIFSQQLTTTAQDSGEESGCFTEGKVKKRSPVTGLLCGEKRWIVKGVQNISERGTGGEGKWQRRRTVIGPFSPIRSLVPGYKELQLA